MEDTPRIPDDAAVPGEHEDAMERADDARERAGDRNDAELDRAQETMDERAREGGADPGSLGR